MAGIMEGLALDAEAGALASSIGDLVERLENTGRLVRLDSSWAATMYRGTMLSSCELDHIDCSALGLKNAPGTPIFQEGRIVLQ